MTYFNIITSTGSRNSASGYGKISLVLMEEKEIISIATQQANRRGEDLTQHTNITWIRGDGRTRQQPHLQHYKNDQ